MRWLAVVALLAGCADNVELLPNVDLAGRLGGGDMGGSAITIPTPSGTTCAAAAAAPYHRFALCSCSPLTTDHKITTTVFDSTGAATNDTGAAIGFDGDFHDSQPVQLAGACYASGSATFDSGMSTTESLRAGTDISATQTASISADAYSGGDVSGSVVVGGTLHVVSSANVASSVQAGAIVREAVTIAAPCDCAGAAAIDVAAIVSGAAQKNDDAAIGLSPSTLTGSTSLPAGTYHVAAISGSDDITLTVSGHVALAVAGDVTLQNALQVQLADGAELDLFVTGTISTASNRTVGAPSAPARVRIWTAAAAMQLGGAPVVGAVITAPSATVSADGGLELYGSLLAQSLAIGSDLVLHYDRAILSSPASCGGAALPPVR